MTDTIILCGPMFAGKTTKMTEIIRGDLQQGKKVLIVKHDCDNRYSGKAEIYTHDGLVDFGDYSFQFVICSNLMDIKNIDKFDTIGIDEGQFFEDLPAFCEIYDGQLKIAISILNSSIKGTAFPVFTELMSKNLYTDCIHLHGVCGFVGCDNPSTNTIKISKSASLIDVHATYTPVCRKHFKEHNLALQQ
jgi:thymidine kinase